MLDLDLNLRRSCRGLQPPPSSTSTRRHYQASEGAASEEREKNRKCSTAVRCEVQQGFKKVLVVS